MSLIYLNNVQKDYINGDVVTPALHPLSLSIEQGEFVAIIGPSGSGKSTLMHILGFLDRPTSGMYEFEGEDTRGFDDDKLALIRNKRLGFVFQSFNLLARTTVLENVILPLYYGGSDGDKKARAEKSLAAVGLSNRLSFFTNQISGGQRQRVAIARALVNDPAVILADEPTGNLDSKSGATVMAILQKLHDEGVTIILVTHDMDVAKHAERIISIKDGMIVSDERVTNRKRVEELLLE